MPTPEWFLDADPLARLAPDVTEAADVLRRYSERVAYPAGQRRTNLQLLSLVSVGNWTVADAANRLGARSHAVQRVAHELVGGGFLIYVDNPFDPLSPFLHLTKSGKELLDVVGEQERRRRSTLGFQLEGMDLSKFQEMLQLVTSIVRSQLGESE
jgi:DNA-binding MarR family transcriptional regulator